MVGAVLNGRKTQTRRIVKDKILEIFDTAIAVGECSGMDEIRYLMQFCPYGQIGDELWVRETFAYVGTTDPGYLVYKATYPECAKQYGFDSVPDDIKDAGDKWTPSIHMPRKVSRIQLRITDIRVERLNDISEGDALSEGIKYRKIGDDFEGDTMYYCKNYMAKGAVAFYANANDDLDEDILDTEIDIDPISSFKTLWQSINGEPSWANNPWVWVVEFERINL